MLANVQGISGIEGMSDAEVRAEVANGARFVRYLYAFSIIVMTFKRSSDIHFIPAGKSAAAKSLPWTLLTLFAGWWGVPWGPIYSIQSLAKNLGGGYDVTDAVMRHAAPVAPPASPAPMDPSDPLIAPAV